MAKIDLEDAEQVLSGKIFGVNVRAGEDSFVLSGQTRRVDLDTQMQVLTAFLTDPGWRPSAFERVRTFTNLTLDQLGSTPQGVLAVHLESLLHSGDTRWVNPTHADVNTSRLADVETIWSAALAREPIEVTMVGDLTLDQAITAVAKTAGALPARSQQASAPADNALHTRFPAPQTSPVRLLHKGRADQAIAFIAWPTRDYFADPQEARTLSLAAAVMQDRLIQKVRIAEGATYSPSTTSQASEVFPGYGMISASVETPPGKLDSFFRDVETIAADMRDHPVTSDELVRAQQPRVEQIEKAKQTNEYWLGRLAGAYDDPRRLTVIRNTVAGYKAVTVADITRVARKYLRDEAAFKVVVTPETAGSQAKAP